MPLECELNSITHEMANIVENISYIVSLTVETAKCMDNIFNESESALVAHSTSLCGQGLFTNNYQAISSISLYLRKFRCFSCCRVSRQSVK